MSEPARARATDHRLPHRLRPGGTLERSNELNFRVEYVMAVREGMNPDQAKLAAARNISFGSGRIALGFSDIAVTMIGLVDVDFGTVRVRRPGGVMEEVHLGVQTVPQNVRITARLPAAGGP